MSSMKLEHAPMEPDRHDHIESPLELDGISRRRFLALVGASAAVASGVGGCSKIDRGTIVPYTRRPREVTPGIANYYASTFAEGLTAYPVLVKTREGRPIHIEGNDEHPDYQGRTSLHAIADILRLYDPERLRQPAVEGKPATWKQAEARVGAAVNAARQGGRLVALVTGATPSPSRRAVIEEFRRAVPGLVHLAFEPLAPQAERAAATAAFGEALQPRLRFDRADVVVSFQHDFLGSDPSAPVAVREFAAKRRLGGPQDPMNRLWVFEGGMTLTGAKADHRFPIRPSRAAAFGFALARTLHERHGVALPNGFAPEKLAPFDLDKLAAEAGLPAARVHALAADLARAGKTALVLAGPTLPAEAHVAALTLNVMLGAEGHTVDTAYAPAPAESGTFADLARLVGDMKSGRIGAAIFWDVNPAYVYPDASEWAAAARAVPFKVFIGLHADETAQDCQVILPEHHWLESWGDYETAQHQLTLQQPTIGPLYDTKQGEEILLSLAGALGATVVTDYHTYVKNRWQQQVWSLDHPVAFERFWTAALHDGVLTRQAQPRTARTPSAAAIGEAAAKTATSTGTGFELVLHAATGVYDGRYANSGWLQELPDPITRATWTNPLAVSAADAQRLRLSDGDIVKLEVGGRRVEMPVVVQAGQAPGVLSAALGYGRRTLAVATGVGVNLYPLLDAAASAPGHRLGVTLTATGTREELPLTQSHHTMDGRDLVRTLPLAEYAHPRHETHPKHALPSMYPPQRFPEHKWGMAIDLSACVGCGACVVACQSENNVGVVGPEQVLRGREMHWIRIDRYYEGEGDATRAVFQPMLCQQCDDAPCENVCPVNATNHSPDGLNQMAYNRCVGTRYCGNNCPYKVRRFNFLEYTAGKTDPERLVFNPEVTVRPRGVMEKCTFCVQRIEDAKIRAKGEARPIRDGEIRPACAAACPAEAIVFGDLKDPASAVAKHSGSDRGYRVLEALGVRPAVTYLANLVNPAEGGKSHAS